MSTSPHFETVTIIGVGLLGASLGLALKLRGICGEVIGVGRRKSSLESALERGAIDSGDLSLSRTASRADLVVIATPAAQATAYLDQLKDSVGDHTTVTDVVSTKGEICRHAAATWPAPRRFVGSHPMAGSEKWGPEFADPDLFEGAVTFVENDAGLDSAAVGVVCSLWEAVGSRVVRVGPDEHDQLVAATSHLPHVVAAAIAQGLPEGVAVRAAIGPGFRDVTRVAGGRPELWRDICLTNRDAIQAALCELQTRLQNVQDALTAADGVALEEFFARGSDARQKAIEE